MFGIKFRTWMESHIVRPRKKQRSKDVPGGKGKSGKTTEISGREDGAGKSLIADTKDRTLKALRCETSHISDVNGKFASIEAIALSTPNHHGYIGTSNNLSSPESAYSTGYSTDGTSPGAPAPFPPPEYYINIRTGTHYFLPNATNGHSKPATFMPTNLQMLTSPLKASNNSSECHSHRASHLTKAPSNNDRAAPLSSAHYNLTTNGKTCNQNLKPSTYLNPPKIGEAARAIHRTHRRTESCDESRRFGSHDLNLAPTSTPTPMPAPNPDLTPASPLPNLRGSSPRQRTRIRTNPWLSSTLLTACVSHSPSPGSFKNSHSATDSNASSSSGFKKGTAESCSSRGSSCDKRSAKPVQFSGQYSGQFSGPEADRRSLCSSSSSCSQSVGSDLTDDDLTLNEMMGKFDESYIYEKETDILSDSDPTDCDETDFEAQEGGDERDTQDEEELDFIDNGSLVELSSFDIEDGSAPSLVNKGHCTYHDVAKKPRFRESVYRRSNSRARDENGSPICKRSSVSKEQLPIRRSNRESCKYRKHESQKPAGNHPPNNIRGTTEKKKVRNVVHKSARERNMQSRIRTDDGIFGVAERSYFGEKDAGGGLSFSQILKHKMMLHESAGGTRSAGSTPIAARRKAFNNEVYSPKKTLRSCSNARFETIFDDELETMSLANSNSHKRRSNSVSIEKCPFMETNNPANKYLTGYSSELALIEADHEADLKYKQLILEAENILTTMKDSTPPIPHRLIPKPNIFSRKVDLDGLFNRSPCTERKELLATQVEPDVLTSRNKNNHTFSPVLRKVGLVSGQSGVKPGQCYDLGYDEIRSDSDGSLTPHQDDLEDLPYQHVNAHPVKYSANGPDQRTISVKSPQLSSDKMGILKSPLLHRKHCHQGEGVRVKDRSSNQAPNRNILIRESACNQPQIVDKVSEYRKKLNGKLGSPLMEKRLKEIMTKENCGNISPKVTRKAMSAFERTTKESDDEKLTRPKIVKSPTLVNVPRPPLVAFRSVDLGNDMDGSSYCPQSEPVKRKVYSCSASFDRLQKSLGEKGQLGSTARKSDHMQAGDNRNSLREELERLRERDEHDLKKPHSPGQQSQRKLSIIRRQLLVNTIEGLKRSLEDQSAKLHAAYDSRNEQQTKCSAMNHS